MASDDWIQESLARVEALENERSNVEAALEEAGDAATIQSLSARLEAIEAELADLMQKLEAAADEPGDEEPATGDFAAAGGDDLDSEAPTGLFSRDDMARMAAQHAAEQAARPAPKPAAPAPQPAPARAPAPAAPPMAAAPAFGAPAAFGAPQAPAFGGGGESYADVEDEPKKGKGALIGIILGVIVVGVGGYLALAGGGDKTEEPTAPSGPVKVIGGGDVPPDTQGPKAAKGADVDSVAGTQFKEGQRPRPAGGGSGSGSGSTSTTPKKKTDDKTKIVETDDPLAGIDTK